MVKDPTTTAQVYHMMYCGGQPPKKTETVPQVSLTQLNSKIQPFLYSKIYKTKQDKDSIGVLEAVLKNEPE